MYVWMRGGSIFVGGGGGGLEKFLLHRNQLLCGTKSCVACKDMSRIGYVCVCVCVVCVCVCVCV